MVNMIYDVIILGGGPAGVAAGVYAARKRLKTLLVTEEFGGQSLVSDDIENWIGEKHLSGVELAKKLEGHIRNYEDVVDIKTGEKAVEVKKIACESGERLCDFQILTNKKGDYKGKTVILAVGSRRKRLNIPGEEKFEGKGVSFCATCDAPLFRDKKVAVVGGGNAGLEATVDLLPYAKEIYVLEKGDFLKGDPITREKVKSEEKIDIIFNATVKEVLGDVMVEGLLYENKNKEEKKLEVRGVFVEIGSIPNSELVKDLVEVDESGQVKINSKHAATSQEGIFAAGDVTDDPYKQNNISAGDGIKAALAAYHYIQNVRKTSPAKE